MSAPAERRVAFFVGLSDNVGPIKSQAPTPVIFDRVVTNVGIAYDLETGRFTCFYLSHCLLSGIKSEVI